MVNLTRLGSNQINEYFNECNLMAARYKTAENYIRKTLEVNSITDHQREDIYKIIRNKKSFWEVLDKNSEKISEEFRDMCLANKNRSPDIYEEFCRQDLSYWIKLMPTYIKLYPDANEKRLRPIKNLLNNPLVHNIFSKNIYVFINDVFPVLIDYGWIKYFDKMGLRYRYMTFDSDIQRFFVDQIELKIKNSEEIIGPIVNEYLSQKMTEIDYEIVKDLKADINYYNKQLEKNRCR